MLDCPAHIKIGELRMLRTEVLTIHDSVIRYLHLLISTCLMFVTNAAALELKQLMIIHDNQNEFYLPSMDTAYFNDMLFFSARTSEFGSELWRTDGTAEGTVLVKDILPGADSGSPFDLTVWNGALYFLAFDSSSFSNGFDYPYALWRSDGTTEGTMRVFGYGDTDQELLGFFRLYNLQDSLLLFGQGSIGYNPKYRIWKSDGSKSGTASIYNFPDGLEFADGLDETLFVAGNRIYFTSIEEPNRLLWRYDISETSPVLITTLPSSDGYPPQIDFLTELDGKVLFTLDSREKKASIWTTDGTPEGTVKIKADAWISTGFKIGKNKFLGQGQKGAASGIYDVEPWVTDGTTAGTKLVKDLQPKYSSGPDSFFTFKGKHYFFAHANGSYGMYRTDGSAAGTALELNLGQAATFSRYDNAVVFAGHVFYTHWLLVGNKVKFSLWTTGTSLNSTKQVMPLTKTASLRWLPTPNKLFVYMDQAVKDPVSGEYQSALTLSAVEGISNSTSPEVNNVLATPVVKIKGKVAHVKAELIQDCPPQVKFTRQTKKGKSIIANVGSNGKVSRKLSPGKWKIRYLCYAIESAGAFVLKKSAAVTILVK